MSLLAIPDWSLWGLIAVALLIAEMVTTAYVALGFAVAAALVGGLVWLMPGLGLVWQALAWAALGLAVWLALSRLNRRRHRRPDINDFDPRDSLPPSDRRRPPRDDD